MKKQIGKRLGIIGHEEMQIRAHGLIVRIQKTPGEKEMDVKCMEKEEHEYTVGRYKQEQKI